MSRSKIVIVQSERGRWAGFLQRIVGAGKYADVINVVVEKGTHQDQVYNQVEQDIANLKAICLLRIKINLRAE